MHERQLQSHRWQEVSEMTFSHGNVAVQSYEASGSLPYALDQLRWAADFLIEAHISPQQYVAQVLISDRQPHQSPSCSDEILPAIRSHLADLCAWHALRALSVLSASSYGYLTLKIATMQLASRWS